MFSAGPRVSLVLSLYLVPGEGFEPPTFGLQNRCTTTVLTRQSFEIPTVFRTYSTRTVMHVPVFVPGQKRYVRLGVPILFPIP